MSELIPANNQSELPATDIESYMQAIADIKDPDQDKNAETVALKDVSWKLPTIRELKGRVGKFTIRFLPPEVINGKQRIFRSTYSHWLGRGDYGRNLDPVPVLKNGRIYCFKTFGEECPICDVLESHSKEIFEKKDQFPKEEYSNFYKWKRSEQILANILVVQDSHPERLPYALDGYKNLVLQLNDHRLVNFFKNEQIDLYKRFLQNKNMPWNLTDLTKGFNIKITKEDKNVNFSLDIPNGIEDPELVQQLIDGRYELDSFFYKDENYDKMMSDAAHQLDMFIRSHFFQENKYSSEPEQTYDPIASFDEGIPEPNFNPDMYRKMAQDPVPQVKVAKIEDAITSELDRIKSKQALIQQAPIQQEPVQQAVQQKQDSNGLPNCYGESWGKLKECDGCPHNDDCVME